MFKRSHSAFVCIIDKTITIMTAHREGDILRYGRNFALITCDPCVYKNKPLFFVKAGDLNTFDAQTGDILTTKYRQRLEKYFEQNPQQKRVNFTVVPAPEADYKHVLIENAIFSFVDNQLVKNLVQTASVTYSTMIPYIALGFALCFVFLTILSVFSPAHVLLKFGG